MRPIRALLSAAGVSAQASGIESLTLLDFQLFQVTKGGKTEKEERKKGTDERRYQCRRMGDWLAARISKDALLIYFFWYRGETQ